MQPRLLPRRRPIKVGQNGVVMIIDAANLDAVVDALRLITMSNDGVVQVIHGEDQFSICPDCSCSKIADLVTNQYCLQMKLEPDGAYTANVDECLHTLASQALAIARRRYQPNCNLGVNLKGGSVTVKPEQDLSDVLLSMCKYHPGRRSLSLAA